YDSEAPLTVPLNVNVLVPLPRVMLRLPLTVPAKADRSLVPLPPLTLMLPPTDPLAGELRVLAPSPRFAVSEPLTGPPRGKEASPAPPRTVALPTTLPAEEVKELGPLPRPANRLPPIIAVGSRDTMLP